MRVFSSLYCMMNILTVLLKIINVEHLWYYKALLILQYNNICLYCILGTTQIITQKLHTNHNRL